MANTFSSLWKFFSPSTGVCPKNEIVEPVWVNTVKNWRLCESTTHENPQESSKHSRIVGKNFAADKKRWSLIFCLYPSRFFAFEIPVWLLWIMHYPWFFLAPTEEGWARSNQESTKACRWHWNMVPQIEGKGLMGRNRIWSSDGKSRMMYEF